MRIEQIISDKVIEAVKTLYGANIDSQRVQIQKTRKEFKGDLTIVVFTLLAFSKKTPDDTAVEIGRYLETEMKEISDYNVVKGFLNLSFTDEYWLSFFTEVIKNENYGFAEEGKRETVVVEFSSPNTNKPLHLGHIRNNLLGDSVSAILTANGYNVKKVNLVNDRGIHICKSMLAWQEKADGETPEKAEMKGDHFVGKYYVIFDRIYKSQIQDLIAEGESEEEAKKNAPWIKKAHGMLKRWERGNKKVLEQWKMMNDWVYEGFDETYKRLGVEFDKTYYESQTYLKGKEIVMDALRTGELYQKEDGTVFLDLSEYGMDEKILLRADGTTVYMTQDIGTAVIRYNDFKFDESIYVVGNEQDYHFKVLSIVLDKLEYSWSNRLTHLSYGMVELPEGKMKSREGTVVDADELIDEMYETAKETSSELGKLNDISEEEKEITYHKIAMAALKYYILKVDAKKNMTFNPKESIDFNGNTGPFIQYTYVRIKSLLRKAIGGGIEIPFKFQPLLFSDKEKVLLKQINDFLDVVIEAGEKRNPSVIANFIYEIAKNYNKLYQEESIIKEENINIRGFRLALSEKIGDILEKGLGLLKIEVPEIM